MTRLSLLFTAFASVCVATLAVAQEQDVTGAQVLTHEAYQYGRFEVRMQSAPGDGIVSSYFLYNVDVECNWPVVNNEIDVEMTGNVEDIYFTTHYPGPWHIGEQFDVAFNPHEEMHDYAMEWEPGIVRWFIDGELWYTQDASFVDQLIYPMRVLMNLWVANATTWVGDWDASVLPRTSHYEWVKVYGHVPGEGDAGTNNNFSLLWEDHFEGDALNPDIWEVTQYGGFEGNLSGFYGHNVSVTDGQLHLHLTEPTPALAPVPVTFHVDIGDMAIDTWDNINLNGDFNDWCGSCVAMADDNDDGVYDVTIFVTPGEYEYLFTLNFWELNGGAPLGSACDWESCDEWANYGFTVPEDSEAIDLPTWCWGTCSNACATSVSEAVQAGISGYIFENQVYCELNEPGKLEVFNLAGQLLFRSEVKPGQGPVTLPESLSGVLHFSLQTTGSRASFTGVVTR